MALIGQRGHWGSLAAQQKYSRHSAATTSRASSFETHDGTAPFKFAGELGSARQDLKDVRRNVKEIKAELKRRDGTKQEQRDRLKEVTTQPAFSFIVACVILLNIVYMVIQIDFPHLVRDSVWESLNHAFILFFTAELGLRLFAEGVRGFFCTPHEWGWNVFDAGVVTISWVMCVAACLEGGGHHHKSGSLVKLLRTVRILRILRVVRISKRLQKLNTIVQGLTSSLSVVAWIGVLQMMVMFCSAIICTNCIGQQAHDWEGEDQEEIMKFFGSMARSGMTLFQFLTLADWSDIARLVAKRNVGMAGFFVVYICFAAMLILSLLTGVLADHVNSVREQREAEENAEAQEAFSEALKAEYRAFQQATTTRRHAIDKMSFVNILSKKSFRAEFKICGVDLDDFDAGELFDSFDSMGDGDLTWQDFRVGLEEMRTGVVPKEVFKLEAALQRAIESCEGRSQVQHSGVYAENEKALETASCTALNIQRQLDSLIASIDGYIEQVDEAGPFDSLEESDEDSSD